MPHLVCYVPDGLAPANESDAQRLLARWFREFDSDARLLVETVRELAGGSWGAFEGNQAFLFVEFVLRWRARGAVDHRDTPSHSTFRRLCDELKRAGLLHFVGEGKACEIRFTPPVTPPPDRQLELFERRPAPPPVESAGPKLHAPSAEAAPPLRPAPTSPASDRPVRGATPIGATLGELQEQRGLVAAAPPIAEPDRVAERAVKILAMAQQVDPLTDLGPCVRVACGIERSRADAAVVIAELQRVAATAKAGRTADGSTVRNPGAYLVGAWKTVVTKFGVAWDAASDDEVWRRAMRLAGARGLKIQPSKDAREALKVVDRRERQLAALRGIDAGDGDARPPPEP